MNCGACLPANVFGPLANCSYLFPDNANVGRCSYLCDQYNYYSTIFALPIELKERKFQLFQELRYLSGVS
jgi:hypothetical protein